MEPRIRILKDGPYLVMGNIPLYDGEIVTDEEGHTIDIIEKGEYPPRETYVLCGCGESGDKPYCDGTHSSIGFDGTETASRDPLYFTRSYI